MDDKLLVIDIGNTNIVGGVYEGLSLTESIRIHTVTKKTEDEYALIFGSLLAARGVSLDSIFRVLISSVVPVLSRPISEMARKLFGREPIILGPDNYRHLPIRVTNPHEIGCDLVADLTAAYARFGQASVVVDFGTALTFSAVDDSGTIAGVSIAPGLTTAIASLSRDTAQLPYVELSVPDSALGQNTVQAIQAGVVLGYVGLVESLVSRMKAELGAAKVVATGGLCGVIAPLTDCFDLVEPNLTLDGLALAARRIVQA
jgi:type III pantothenate kinase